MMKVFALVLVLAIGFLEAGCSQASGGKANQVAAEVEPATSEQGVESSELALLPDRVFRCGDGYVFSVAPKSGRVLLWTADSALHEPRELDEVVSGNGARFEAPGLVFWGRGPEALVEVAGQVHANCQEEPMELVWEKARLRGLEFRAVGNEPGWLLELDGQGVATVALDYGRNVFEFTGLDQGTLGGGREMGWRARDEKHQLEVKALREECEDSMSGAVHGWQVELVLDGQAYLGCGRTF